MSLYQGPIIDTHLHIWDVERLYYPWLADLPLLNRSYLPEDYSKATQGLNIEKMVFAQCECDPKQFLEEADWVVEQSLRDPRIQGMIAWAPLEDGTASEAALEQLKEIAILKGIRRIIEFEPDDDFCLQPGFIEGVRLCGEHDLTFDINVKGDAQLRNVIKLIDACPKVRFMLDHIGKPFIQEQLMEPWSKLIREIAERPHVHCKISGLVVEADKQVWKYHDLVPYMDHVFEAFGVDRIAFGGDWPVVLLASPYLGWVEALTKYISDFSEKEQQQVFYYNAIKFYSL
ncbi:MAG: amidohydrolase family protein [Cyclobacteriaceae bacterium]